MTTIRETLSSVNDDIAVAIFNYMIEYAGERGGVLPSIRIMSRHFQRHVNFIFRKMQKLVNAGILYQPEGEFMSYGIVGARVVVDVDADIEDKYWIGKGEINEDCC